MITPVEKASFVCPSPTSLFRHSGISLGLNTLGVSSGLFMIPAGSIVTKTATDTHRVNKVQLLGRINQDNPRLVLEYHTCPRKARDSKSNIVKSSILIAIQYKFALDTNGLTVVCVLGQTFHSYWRC